MPDANRPVKYRAQVGVTPPTAVRMWSLFILAIPVVVQSAVAGSPGAVSVAAAALFAAVAAELVATYRNRGLAMVRDGSACASAMVLALMLPAGINPLYAAVAAAFAILVAKHSFGGLGSNWLNPALAGWLLARLSWPRAFAAIPAEAAVASATDSAVGGFLNRTVLGLLGAELPPGYIDLFWRGSPGAIADGAPLAMILLVAAMFAMRVVSRWWVCALHLGVLALLTRLFGALPSGGGLWEGDVLLGALSGGTLVASFVLIAEPSGGARSSRVAAALAVMAAVMGFLFRYPGGEPHGAFFAVAAANALSPTLSALEDGLLYARPSRAGVPAEKEVRLG